MDTATESIHVLHVDDEPDVAELAAEFLEREDDRFAVETATSASDGLDLLADTDYDCIVSDYDMPRQDGIDFLEAVRERHEDLPFILYTGKGTEAIASDAITAGVTDYLQKGSGPDQYTVLANRITNSVAKSRASQKIEGARERHKSYRKALVELLTDDAVKNGDFKTAIRRITETAAELLNVPRVNIWLIEDDADETMLTCVDHYVRATGNHSGGMELETEKYPTYFEALQTHRAIDATDAHEDPRTAELADYLNANDIGSLLDATLRSEGETIGVVCHEQVGGPREWTDDQINFASNIADVIHRALRNQKRNEREQALERYDALFDSVDDALALIEYRGETPVIRNANPAFEALFAGGEEDIDEVVASDDQVAEARTISQQVQEGELIQTEVTRETTDGLRTFDLRAVPIEDRETGEFESAFAIYSDITERTEREQDLERYQTLIEATADPMYMLDENGCFTYVNDAVVEIAGYSKATLVGEHISKAMEEEHIERGDQLIRSLLSAGERQGTFEMDIVTAAGERIPTENHISLLVSDGEFHGTVGVLRDITDRLERERQLQHERDRLDEFAGVVSHDLRNPLNVANGRLDLAMEDCESEHLEPVAQALDRMGALIEDVLSLARSGEVVGETESVELPDLVETCWQTIETASAELVVDTEATVQADATRLQQLFENLVRNAVEHGGEDVTITIGDQPDGFYVEDDGPGIPEDERDSIFDASYTTAADGTGLGLSIVREVAEAHGWAIKVTDSSDGGARFEVTGVQVDG